MKLGKDTGSIINYLSETNPIHIPVVGENVTELMWSDREAYQVLSVDKDQKGAVICRYIPKYIGKEYGDESYQYEDEDGNPLIDKNYNKHIRFRYGSWYQQSDEKKFHKINLSWGMKQKYCDPSF